MILYHIEREQNLNNQFTWDENKERENIKNHGISFTEAMTVFADAGATVIYDVDHSEDEDRFIIIGFSRTPRLLLVCYCEREDDLIRIISARRPEKEEAALYGGGWL